ncbi:hypothetical protein [Reichenbachiella sp.]|uniref:hypothetical protein n=1 Tax=Reichenbachiella sp. TaxID=2184521 RepID=UPI0032986F5B
MPKFVDIFSLICPMDNKIKWVGASSSGRIPLWLKKHSGYKYWKTYLKSKGLEAEIVIFDCVSPDEVSFQLNFYSDLFKGWGFDLFKEEYVNHKEVEVDNLANSLMKILGRKELDLDNIIHHSVSLESYYEIPNLEMYLEHLASQCRKIDLRILIKECQLFLCFTCYMGMSASHLAKLKWSDLNDHQYTFCAERDVFLKEDQHTLDVARNLYSVNTRRKDLILNTFKWSNNSLGLTHLVNSLFYLLRSNIRIGPGSQDLNAIYALLTFDRYGRNSINSLHLVDYFGLKNISELICLLDRFCTNERQIRLTKYEDHKRLIFTGLY